MFRHLQVLNMEYRLNHESIPLNEEKQMVRDIKRLHSQRPRVRQFEAMAAEQEQTRAAARAAPQVGPNLGEMEQERKVRRCAGLWPSTAEVHKASLRVWGRWRDLERHVGPMHRV